ncbi:MAG: HAD family hydrolase [Verrucomicrobiota bacterium]|nr:HAD family hydrolase [Verrucomicrobiota bacterium]
MQTAGDQLQIELLPSFTPRPKATHAIFDFDGTLSWIRHGWPEVMQSLMVARFPLAARESPDDLRISLFKDMYRFNGRPTSVYMEAMSRQIQERGGEADPSEMLEAYLIQLDQIANERHEQIRSETCSQDDFIVFGGRALIELMISRRLKIIILSGNPHGQVNEEAKLLDLTRYCHGHVYGYKDANNFSKQSVIEELMLAANFSGENLVAIGDGAGEITAAKALDGLAVAVCSDETNNGSGLVDKYKRNTLVDAGADAIIADYQEPEALLKTILGE